VIGLLALIEATAAQPAPGAAPALTESLRQAVVDAIRNCPHGDNGEVIVCKLDPRFATNLRPSGRGELPADAGSATGAQSCSNVGASGSTGCTKKAIDSWGEWKKQKKKEEDAAFPW
jgi:hypothetical protein